MQPIEFMIKQTILLRFYESLKQEGHEVEIIFVSADRSEADFKDVKHTTAGSCEASCRP